MENDKLRRNPRWRDAGFKAELLQETKTEEQIVSGFKVSLGSFPKDSILFSTSNCSVIICHHFNWLLQAKVSHVQTIQFLKLSIQYFIHNDSHQMTKIRQFNNELNVL